MSTGAPQTHAESDLLRPFIPAAALEKSKAASAKADECNQRLLAANEAVHVASEAATAAVRERNRLRKRYETLLRESCTAFNDQVEADAAAWAAAREALAAKGGTA